MVEGHACFAKPQADRGPSQAGNHHAQQRQQDPCHVGCARPTGRVTLPGWMIQRPRSPGLENVAFFVFKVLIIKYDMYFLLVLHDRIRKRGAKRY